MGVGDIVDVQVLSVDLKKQRIQLTMKIGTGEAGTQKDKESEKKATEKKNSNASRRNDNRKPENKKNAGSKERNFKKGMEIIPVVYIVNNCFKANTKTNSISSDKSGGKSSDETPRQLADKILNRILQMNEANDIENVKEIQIDCDWTASTQEAYFEFLHYLKEKAKDKQIQLSATIRLHQLSMTPPPVDRGILMMYNTGDVKQLSCQKPSSLAEQRNTTVFPCQLCGFDSLHQSQPHACSCVWR